MAPAHAGLVRSRRPVVRVTHFYPSGVCGESGMGCPSRRSPFATGEKRGGVERLLRVPILHWSETVEAEPGDWSLRAHLVCSASLRLCAKHDELPPLTARG